MAEKTMNVVSYRDFIDPREKNEDFILKSVQQHYNYGGARNLLAGKRTKDIFDYAAGNHSMNKFLAMFPDAKKKVTRNTGNRPSELDLANHSDLMMDRDTAVKLGIDLQPLGILQQPLSSALAVLQKSLVYVGFRAIDATSNANRKMDMDRLRNRPAFEQAIGPAKEILGMPLQAPGTEHNSPTIDISTLGLDPAKEDQLNIYANTFYKLRPETAFEVATDAILDMVDFREKLDIQKRDTLYFGVQTSRQYFSQITGLPNYDYEFPGHVYTPPSELPDFSDQPFRYTKKNYNVEALLNAVGKESLDEEFVHGLFEQYWKTKGYQDWKWDKAPAQRKQDGMPIIYMEFKSFDVIRVQHKKTASGRQHREVVPFGYKLNSNKKNDPNDFVQNKWPQQTYYAYWVPDTDVILKSGKLEGIFRAKGKENKSKFGIQIYKSKEKSDVELCMSAVDDAQRAYIKMQVAVIMAKPKGVYVDMKYLRNSAESMAADLALSVEDLINLFFVKNVMLGDTEGMDGQNEGNFLPFREIPGGIGGEVAEFLSIVQDAHKRIAQLTGWNDALTGQTPNSDQLVGLQKLLLQSSYNSLHYAQKASKKMTENTVEFLAPMVQYICKPENKQTQARKALENIIGSVKMAIINDMDELSLTQFGLTVEDAPNEEAQAELKNILVNLLQGQRIELSDYFLIKRVKNTKDAENLLIIKELKKAQEVLQMQMDSNQAIRDAATTREQGELQRTAMGIEGQLAERKLQNEGTQTVEQMKAQLQIVLKEMANQAELTKKNMQGQQMKDKLLQKHNLDAVKGIGKV